MSNLPVDSGTKLLPVSTLFHNLIGRRPSPATIWRWTRHGVKSANGGKVRLHAVKCFGSWHCRYEDAERFLARQTPQPIDDQSDAPTARSERTRQKLQAAGLL